MTDQSRDPGTCSEVEDHLVEILEGSAPEALYDHIAECDACRDLRYEAERLSALIADAGADYAPADDLEEKLIAELRRRGGDGAPAAPADESTAAPADTAPAGTRTLPIAEALAAEPATESASAKAGAPITEVPVDERREREAVTQERLDTLESVKAAERPKTAPMPAAEAAAGSLMDRPRAVAPKVALLATRRARLVLGGGLVAALAAAAVGGVYLRGGVSEALRGSADGAWTATVSNVVSATGTAGLSVCASDGACEPLAKAGAAKAGSALVTDGVTRAELTLEDGSKVTLDRNTRIELSSAESRRAKLVQGAIVADVSKVEGKTARFDFPKGYVRVLGTKLALKLTGDSATVDVSRGVVELADEADRKVTVRAGEEGRLVPGAPPFVSAAPALGEAIAWSEAASGENDVEDVAARGLGELKAQKPGEKDERSGAVSLTSHSVKVRVAGVMARTEIDEVFTNNTDDVLEGIYRFPIPPDAKIERLALEVNGKLEEGAFVDRDRAASIWRGAIVNSAPQLRRQIRDEIVWVPGPWEDPALLEWQRGGRFELRIFPIPKRGSRRVILAYTQMLKPTGGVRRYSYPLPHDPSGSVKVAKFDVDVEVRGHDPAFGVKSYGYELASSKAADADKLTMGASDFVPSGDLTVELALPNRDAELTAWAYKAADGGASKPAADAKDTAPSNDAYVALALRPKLPRVTEGARRTFALVVDSSRSMFGENYRRAIAVAVKTVRELDRGDRFTLLTCDTSCRTMSGGLLEPSMQTAVEVRRFLEGQAPEGASDPTAAIASAREAARGSEGELRVVYIGDGAPTVGPIRPAYVTRAVQDAMPPGSGTVTTVAIGADSDLDTLAAMARGGGGVVLPFVPGQSTAEAAFAVLGTTYGTTLRDVTVELPPGLTEVAPKQLDTIVAGSEEIVVARMRDKELAGTVIVRGKLGKETFEQRYPVRLAASEAKGNAFVPRLFAATRISDLEREPASESKKEAVRLSSEFDVASRYTSLLVLESAAMFRAFGLDNTRTSHQWTGEETAEATLSAGLNAVEDEAQDVLGKPKESAGFGGLGSGASGAASPAKKSAPGSFGGDFDDFGPREEAKAQSPAADRAFEPAPSPTTAGPGWSPPPPMSRPRGRRMVPMRRIWERKGTIAIGGVPKNALPSAIAMAERELEQNPNRRAAVQKVYSLYMLAGDVERAFTTAERWSQKEPLDSDALTARADLAARGGDRELAIRILGSVVDVRPDDVASQRRLARAHRWAGRADVGCRHSLALAQIRSGDARLLAEAVSCGRQTGQTRLVEEMLSAAEERVRRAAEPQIATFDKQTDALSGDLRVEATWSGGVDVDVAIITPDGHRVSWLGAPTREVISAVDVQSLSGEGLALRGAKPGEYVIELVKPAGTGTIRGDLTLTVAGTRRVVPFTLNDTRETIGVAKIAMQSRLVPAGSFGGGW